MKIQNSRFFSFWKFLSVCLIFKDKSTQVQVLLMFLRVSHFVLMFLCLKNTRQSEGSQSSTILLGDVIFFAPIKSLFTK